MCHYLLSQLQAINSEAVTLPVFTVSLLTDCVELTTTLSHCHCQAATLSTGNSQAAALSHCHCQAATLSTGNCKAAALSHCRCQEATLSTGNCQATHISQCRCKEADR